MSEIRSIAGANTYLAREATPGGAIDGAYFGMPAVRMRPGFEGDREVVRGGSGKAVSSSMGTDLKGAWNVETFSADFNHLGLVAASVISLPETTTPGGGTNSRQHVFSKNPNAEDTKRTYKAIWGDPSYAVLGEYGYFNNLGMNIQRGQLDFSTSFRSRAPQFSQAIPTAEVQTLSITGAPTGGDFTITYAGQTTAAIDFDATAAEVQAALIALSNIGAYDVICTGGPLPTSDVVITFKGDLAQTDVALMTTTDSLTGGTAPESAIVQTTAGAAVTDIAQAPMPSNMWDVYIDDSWANLGNTHYGGAYVANPSFGDKFEEDAPINSSIVSFEEAIEMQEQDDTFELTIRFGAQALAMASDFNVGELQYFRLALSSANAAAIAAGTDYYIEGSIPWSCTLDFAVIITSLGEISTAPNSSVQVLPMTLSMAKSGTDYAELTLVNTVTAY